MDGFKLENGPEENLYYTSRATGANHLVAINVVLAYRAAMNNIIATIKQQMPDWKKELLLNDFKSREEVVVCLGRCEVGSTET